MTYLVAMEINKSFQLSSAQQSSMPLTQHPIEDLQANIGFWVIRIQNGHFLWIPRSEGFICNVFFVQWCLRIIQFIQSQKEQTSSTTFFWWYLPINSLKVENIWLKKFNVFERQPLINYLTNWICNREEHPKKKLDKGCRSCTSG